MKCYIVDAFAEKLFEGNPAAVCILERWLSDALMQQIAMENNLSETAFAVKEGADYRLRWFTPTEEIDLCGHATLATAYIIHRFYAPSSQTIHFHTASGTLSVTKNNDFYEMRFPAYALKEVPVTKQMISALGATPTAAYLARDLLCIMEHEDIIHSLSPDLQKIRNLEGAILHVTAKSKDYDCVSRSFAPKLGVDEDPVCGSGHCHIAPFWANQLGKEKIIARQASKRGGTLYCSVSGARVILSGKAVLYAVMDLFI
ncbi:MAG: PhzF family phenazine biosynthesis protein [Christensenellaceae bacterium]|jgi:PhzF family phenazine biosynthesis protein